MNGLAKICWIASGLYLLGGMGFGIWMSIAQDHSLASAHAHLNLLGGVLLALFGTFYALMPMLAAGRLAKIHVLVANLAALTMFPGVIMAISGQGETLAKIGSVLAILTILLFLVQVMRAPLSRSA